MLTYKDKFWPKSKVLVGVKVYLDGKLIGTIAPVLTGWRYEPKGCSEKLAGETMKTIELVKISLETE